MNRGILFVVSGPAGTGKGTICERLLETENVFLSVSSTTRDMRKNEVAGKTYNYISVEEFESLIAEDEMLEYAVYNGNYYGTPRQAVEKELEAGRNVILEIEAQGAMKVKAKFPEAVLIFVTPPSIKELRKRLVERGRETEEQIEERIQTAKWELTQAYKYAHILINDDLDACVKEVAEIFRRTADERNHIENLLKEI